MTSFQNMSKIMPFHGFEGQKSHGFFFVPMKMVKIAGQVTSLYTFRGEFSLVCAGDKNGKTLPTGGP